MSILLVGAGPMASDYVEVLQHLNLQFDVVCRSEESASKFYQKHKIKCVSGALNSEVHSGDNYSSAIIAVDIGSLFSVTKFLINSGVRNILLEKPAALYLAEIEQLLTLSREKNSKIFVAFNRRFYSSVEKLIELAERDGGIKSLSFDFTEWSDKISPLEKSQEVKDRWVLSNSSHVLDLAFYLVGKPKEITCFQGGSIDWHRNAARFNGAGITELDVPFSYRADWDSAGRWCITAYSKNFKFDLSPLEQLHLTKRNELNSNRIVLDSYFDQKFKPGLYQQVEVFLKSENMNKLCSLDEHKILFAFYSKIAGYSI